MSVQHLDIAGQQMVVLTREEFARLVEDAEHYADICAAVSAEERAQSGEEYVPASLANRIMDGESPLKVWREYRGLNQTQLGAQIGCRASWISKLEKGQAKGDVRVWRALATALAVELDDIAPAD